MNLFFFAPILIFAFIALIVILIIRGLLQGFSSGGSATSASPNVVTQLGDDGFWIVSCPADPLSIIHYYYWAGGVRHAGHIPFQPDNDGRQFVYTGRRPEQVSIARIVDESDDSSPGLLPPVIGASSVFWDNDSSSPPSPPSPSFPSAY